MLFDRYKRIESSRCGLFGCYLEVRDSIILDSGSISLSNRTISGCPSEPNRYVGHVKNSEDLSKGLWL